MSEQHLVKLLHTRGTWINTHTPTHKHVKTPQSPPSITHSSLLDLNYIAAMTQNFSLTHRDKIPLDVEHIKMQ